MAQEDIFKKLVAHCKEYGYVFQSSEIYDGLAAVYDYGQYGVELKKQYQKVLVGLYGAVTRERGRIGFRHFHAPDHLESLRTRGCIQRSH